MPTQVSASGVPHPDVSFEPPSPPATDLRALKGLRKLQGRQPKGKGSPENPHLPRSKGDTASRK